jgi:peptidoglycan/xylan/chitin deacetylase (PgdA/CDA1 family)
MSEAHPIDLYRANHPARFWRLTAEPAPSDALWQRAAAMAAGVLPAEVGSESTEIGALLFNTLGEGQFGPDHWRLDVFKRAYYTLKPVLPRGLSHVLRRLYRRVIEPSFRLGWPIEDRYARFQWGVLEHLLHLTGRRSASYIDFWPNGHPFAFTLTHDVETGEGQAFVRSVADLDSSYGFRSSFNFVVGDYRLDQDLIEELEERGFEVGVHGVHHDGKGFWSRDEFLRRSEYVNRQLPRLHAVGYRAPLTHRHPVWMQALDIEYDLSFFDTDPFEPMAGGTMSLWPFSLGRFIELPYTLVQDHTLTAVLGETTPRIWLDKVDFIRRYSGLALVITHPDYLREPQTWRIYADFLRSMRNAADFWHALPRDVARWWRRRAETPSAAALSGAVERTVELDSPAMLPRTAAGLTG